MFNNFEVNKSMVIKTKAGNSPCRFSFSRLKELEFYTGTHYSTYNIIAMLYRKYGIFEKEDSWLKKVINHFFDSEVIYSDRELLHSWINWNNIGYEPFIEFGSLDPKHNWHKTNVFEKKPTHIGFYLCREAACFSNKKVKNDLHLYGPRAIKDIEPEEIFQFKSEGRRHSHYYSFVIFKLPEELIPQVDEYSAKLYSEGKLK